MEETLQFLARHGLVVLFLFVLAEQVGLPLPAIPVLLAVGALSRTGHLEPGAAWRDRGFPVAPPSKT